MSDIDINYIVIIAGAALLSFIVGGIALRNGRARKELAEAAQAAILFKSKILDELKGLYPIPQYLKPEDIDKFRATVPRVEAAAAEFRPFVEPERRDSFDNALKKYGGHCKRITWTDCIATNILPGKKKADNIEPKEIFRQNVNALLSFTKEL